MIKIIISIALLTLVCTISFAQSVGIGTSTPNSSAMLDVSATNKGMLVPRVALIDNLDAATIPSPTNSLLIYNTASAGSGRFAVTPGYYSWNSASLTWIPFLMGDNSDKGAWLMKGNLATSLTTNFIGTTDNQSLLFKINNLNAGFLGVNGNTNWGLNSGNTNNNGVSNVAIGSAALSQTVNRSNLVAVGDSALMNNGAGASMAADATNNTAIGSKAMLANTKGNDNTAIGFQTLKTNTNGIYNTAVGSKALISNTTGNANIALGTFSLFSNSTGSNNIANGYQALLSNTTGFSNVAIGKAALLNSVTGSNIVAIGDSALLNYENNSTSLTSLYGNNMAVGSKALYTATTGTSNTAVGNQALYANTIGNFNAAIGNLSLQNNTTGSNNIAVGISSMANNITGYNNVAIGSRALLGNNSSGYANVAIGDVAMLANISGYGNSAVGNSSLTSNTIGINNVAIGSLAMLQNTIGSRNSSLGSNSLSSNSSGSKNVAIGADAMQRNKTGIENVAIGTEALLWNTDNNNVAIGYRSLYLNTSGNANTAVGHLAQYSNETGSNNTANGSQALYNNLSGNDNTAFGRNALANITRGDFNTALGESALSSAALVNKNTAIGYKSDAPGILSTNATAIGAHAIANCSNCMVLGSVPGLNGGTANINVGIGTTTPQTDLHLNPNGAGSILIGTNKYSGGYTNLEMGVNTQSNGYGFIQATKSAGINGGDLILNQSGGNVGIGANTPQTDLHVNPNGAGSILIGTNKNSGGYTNLEMGITSQSGGKGYIQSTNVSGTSYGDMHLNPSGGYVGINLPTGTTAFAPLDIKQSSINRGLRLRNTYNSNGWDIASNGTLNFYVGGLYVLEIGQDGSYNQISDQRLKTNVVKMENVLDKVMALKPSKYQYINNNPTHKISTGFLAQEIMPIFPELVSDFKHPTGDTTDNTVYHTINYTGFSVIAIKALQEQQQQIESLKAQLIKMKEDIIVLQKK